MVGKVGNGGNVGNVTDTIGGDVVDGSRHGGGPPGV